MHSQKRIKTVGPESRDISYKKQGLKASLLHLPPKQHQNHSKSVSKDITPSKNTVSLKIKPSDMQTSSKKINKAKQMVSQASCSFMEKQSMPATKRKASYALSSKKSKKPKAPINQQLKSTVNNFTVLTKCLTQFVKKEKKEGKNPNRQVLQLIKAFNKSEVGPLSKNLYVLIENMLNYIEQTVEPSTQPRQATVSRMEKSSSCLSFQENPFTRPEPRITKNDNTKQRKTKTETKEIKHCSYIQLPDLQHDHEQQHGHSTDPRSQGPLAQPDAQVENQLQSQIRSMQEQLLNLKQVGKYLKTVSCSKTQDRRHLQEIFNRNRLQLQQMGQHGCEEGSLQQQSLEQSQQDQ